MINAALVLQGGSLRTLYTAGVLDVFMQNGMEFAFVIGASAGALNGANYIAKHMGRTVRINTLHSNDPNYFGIRQLVTKRNAFNFDYLFNGTVNELYPYNVDALIGSLQRFLITATNCKTGKAEYFETKDYHHMATALRASSSIPMINEFVWINETPYLDGGVSDPMGYQKAFSEGYDKAVLVLTRDITHRKTPVPKVQQALLKRTFEKYPNLAETVITLPERYNTQIEEILRLEKEGKIFVLRPKAKVGIKVMERDARKLLDLYFRGSDCATERMAELKEYLKS